MVRKFAGKQDYAVSKLEAQWWVDGEEDFMARPTDQWRWKLLIRTPDFIAQKDVAAAAATLLKRGKDEEVKRVKPESLFERQCVQMLHVGPYDAEERAIAAMKAFAESKGLSMRGRHHEIYLSDPRRVAGKKLRRSCARRSKTPPGDGCVLRRVSGACRCWLVPSAPAISRGDILLCRCHRRMSRSPRTKPVAVVGKRPVPPALQNLHHRLLNESIQHRWMPSFRTPPSGLGISTRTVYLTTGARGLPWPLRGRW